MLGRFADSLVANSCSFCGRRREADGLRRRRRTSGPCSFLCKPRGKPCISATGLPAERPREKLLARGAGSLSDAELLAIFLGSGLRGRDAVATARELLTEHGPLRALLERSPAQMAEAARPGPGPRLQARRRAGTRPPPPQRRTRTRRRPERPAIRGPLFRPASARPAARGVRRLVPRHPPSRHRLRGTVPRHPRRRRGAPARSGAPRLWP